MSKLAVNGGTPAAGDRKTVLAPWPPVSEETADRLREIYLSREWSFNSASEQNFEKLYAEYHGAEYGVFMSNGTGTLECALTALGVGPGDEVVVPALTWIATAMAVKYVGAKIVFADIDPLTFALDPDAFERAVTPRTRAVIPVHLYGGMADLDRIIAIARRHGIAVIEDCAHMQGGKWNGRGVGSWGDIGSFSFQQSKTLSCGEGGIVLTNSRELAEKLYRCKHIGYSRYDRQGQAGTPPPPGLLCHNYRCTAFQAEILSGQLRGLPDVIARYNRFADRLREMISDVEGVRIQSPGRLASPQGFYALSIVFDSERWMKYSLDTIGRALGAEGAVSLGRTYGPVYRHMLFNLAPGDYTLPPCPATEMISDRAVTLPHYGMGIDENADIIASAVKKVSENLDELREA